MFPTVALFALNAPPTDTSLVVERLATLTAPAALIVLVDVVAPVEIDEAKTAPETPTPPVTTRLPVEVEVDAVPASSVHYPLAWMVSLHRASLRARSYRCRRCLHM